MSTQKWVWSTGLLVCLFVALAIWQWKQGEPRRMCLQRIESLYATLSAHDSGELLDQVFLPMAVADRTQVEQVQFIHKALKEEVTPEGLELLQREAEFGPLAEVFPEDCDNWAKQAGVSVADCLAFRFDHGQGLRMEVVLAKDSNVITGKPTFRIVRCNNVTVRPAVQLSTTTQS